MAANSLTDCTLIGNCSCKAVYFPVVLNLNSYVYTQMVYMAGV